MTLSLMAGKLLVHQFKRAIFLVLLLSGISGATFAQTNLDLNGDGQADPITIDRDAGSGFAYAEAQITDSRTGKVHSLTYDRCFCHFMTLVAIPNTFLELPPAMLTTVKQQLLGNLVHAHPEGSLRWLWQAGRQKPERLSDEWYDFRRPGKPHWYDGQAIMPPDYITTVSTHAANGLFRQLNPMGDVAYDGPESDFSFLVYYGSKHKLNGQVPRFEKHANFGDTAVLLTAHAVVLETETTHAWLYVSDALSWGPEKLRHRSVLKAVSNGSGYVYTMVQGEGFSLQLVVINYQSGSVARVRAKHLPAGWKDLKLDGDRLILIGDRDEQLPIKALQQSLP